MPMPELDPSRFVEAVLADPSHMLPLPDRGGRLFLAEGEVIDTENSFYATLLADGSLVRKIAEAYPAAPSDAADKPIADPPSPDRASKADPGTVPAKAPIASPQN